MANADDIDAANGLNILADLSANREEELQNFNTTRDIESSDDEHDFPCPIFDRLYATAQTEAIRGMTNFTPSQFESVWESLQECPESHYNNGRGKSFSIRVKGHNICNTCYSKEWRPYGMFLADFLI